MSLRIAIGIGLIVISLVVTLSVILTIDRIQAAMPECLRVAGQICPYLSSNMILVYLVVFGLAMPITGIVLVERDVRLIGRR